MNNNDQQPPEPPKENIPPAPNFVPHYNQPPQKQKPEPDPPKIITDPLNTSNLLGALLRRPMDFVATIHKNNAVPWLPLAIIAIICLSLFGLVVGAFSAGDQLWAAPLKIVGGTTFAAIICLPSLYIFASLSGIEARFQTLAAILTACVAITSLLLVGFAPVVWLFSTSSDSAVFFGFLCLTLWLICLTFGFRFISRAAKILGTGNAPHLGVWCGVFLIVTLQMPTTLRPIIGTPGKSEKLLTLDEKKFFIIHWADQFKTNNNKAYIKENNNSSETNKAYR